MDQSKTVWIGQLDGFEDENYFRLNFAGQFDIKKIKIIKSNGVKSEYAFIEFGSRQQAELFIKKFDNTRRPLSSKIDWAQRNKSQNNYQNLCSVYVGDLHKSIDRQELFQIFNQQFSSVKEAKVIVEKRGLNNKKVYGFVYFQDKQEAIEAIRTMNGAIIKGFAKTSSLNPIYQQYPKQELQPSQQQQPQNESKNFFFNYNPKHKTYTPYTASFYEKKQKIEKSQNKIYIKSKINLNKKLEQKKYFSYDFEENEIIRKLFN